MLSFIVLFIFTFLIVFVQFKIWKITPNVIFPVCTLIFYYWSLAGAWIFTIDQSFGEFGRFLNMSYYVYLEKVYPVKLDSTYAQMIVYYGLFILFFQLTIYLILKRRFKNQVSKKSLKLIFLDTRIISVMIFIFIILSFVIVKIPIYKSIMLEESVYANVRKGLVPFYSFHQLFNLSACFLSYFTLAVYLKNDEDSQFKIVKSKSGLVFFILLFIATNVWLVFLGNKHEILILGITSFLFLAYPVLKYKHVKSLILLTVILFVSFVLTDPIRSLAPVLLKPFKQSSFITNSDTQIRIANYVKIEARKSYDELKLMEEQKDVFEKKVKVFSKSKKSIEKKVKVFSKSKKSILEKKEEISINLHIKNSSYVYYGKSKFDQIKIALATIAFSNEMFSGQFSLYASLKEKLPISIGHSFYSAFCVFIPRSIIKDRPVSSYEYYSKKLELDPAQGFTINHATDWYLNFGFIGVLIGGIFWGALISFLYLGSVIVVSDVLKNLSFVSLISVAAYFSMIIRGGIDVLKVIVFESILIPIMLLLVCHFLYSYLILFKKNK
jgi:phage pi2 protein 07